MVVTACVAAVLAPATASAAEPAVLRLMDNHFHTETYWPADPSCGPYAISVTEVADGNWHLVIVDDGVRLTLSYVETFRITMYPDDTSIPVTTRQGTDALSLVLQRDGDSTFHESFHDFGWAAWNPDAHIRFVTIFTTVDGQVLVDHRIENDMPPPGC
jgi:hypothetical protein